MTNPAAPGLCCLSFDVEEYFHIEAAHGLVAKADWDSWPSRVERNVDLLLELLDRHNRKATFFILGHVAEHHPRLAPRVVAAGHEVASHGYGHDRLHRLNPDAFRRDLQDGKHLLEDQMGKPILGYRAPTFSVVPQTAWALDVLAEAGIAYDASIFPVRHPAYGVPTAPDRPFLVQGRDGGAVLLEVPPLTWQPTGIMKMLTRGKKVAVAGGGYFRLLPLRFMERGLDQAAAHKRPAVLYFHPWEFDPGMPRMPLTLVGRLRTYIGLETSIFRLERILRRPGRWCSIAGVLPELRQMAESAGIFRLDRE